uniref:Uncharacterized protein n=1 Tax=Arundo donax TaxID=35708 RepID=A0A0A9CU23_ARUDO
MEKAVSGCVSGAGFLVKTLPVGREEECNSLGEANRARAVALLLPPAPSPALLSPSLVTVDELAS